METNSQHQAVSDFPGDFLPRSAPVEREERARTIIVGARGQYEAIVSEEDYAYLIQWKWTFKISRGGNVYARRGGGRYPDGTLRPTILMHDEVMTRKGEPRPTPEHTADHGNRKTLDNRRSNLDWATKSEQERNKYRRKRS